MVCGHLLVTSLFCLLSSAESIVTPDPLQTSTDHIERTRLFGNINAFAYYFAEILVGTPPQRVSVILDTGSGLCAFPCVGCTHCGDHLDLPFNRSASSTSQALPCGIACDHCLEGNKCGYVEEYTEGSKIKGIWFKDLVKLNGSDKDNQPVTVNMGCHTEEMQLFYTQKVNGILGLAPHKITGKSNLLQDFFQDKKHVNHAVFSFCFAEWGGLWTVGGYDSSYILPDFHLEWMPLHHTGYFGLRLEQIQCGPQIVGSDMDFGTTILDSGTTFTYFPHQTYWNLLNALKTQCAGTLCDAIPVPHSYQSCWKLLNSTSPSRFPNVSIGVQGADSPFLWRPESYMFRRHNKEREWCFAFADNKLTHTTVLGISFFLHKTVVFDTSKSRIGIAESACPENHYRTAKAEQGQLLVAKIADGLPRGVPASDIPTEGNIHFLSICLGVVGLFLLLVALAVCLWASFGDDEEEDDSEVQLTKSVGDMEWWLRTWTWANELSKKSHRNDMSWYRLASDTGSPSARRSSFLSCSGGFLAGMGRWQPLGPQLSGAGNVWRVTAALFLCAGCFFDGAGHARSRGNVPKLVVDVVRCCSYIICKSSVVVIHVAFDWSFDVYFRELMSSTDSWMPLMLRRDFSWLHHLCFHQQPEAKLLSTHRVLWKRCVYQCLS